MLCFFVEQATGIEPACSAWEADILPLNYACINIFLLQWILLYHILFYFSSGFINFFLFLCRCYNDVRQKVKKDSE